MGGEARPRVRVSRVDVGYREWWGAYSFKLMADSESASLKTYSYQLLPLMDYFGVSKWKLQYTNFGYGTPNLKMDVIFELPIYENPIERLLLA